MIYGWMANQGIQALYQGSKAQHTMSIALHVTRTCTVQPRLSKLDAKKIQGQNTNYDHVTGL